MCFCIGTHTHSHTHIHRVIVTRFHVLEVSRLLTNQNEYDKNSPRARELANTQIERRERQRERERMCDKKKYEDRQMISKHAHKSQWSQLKKKMFTFFFLFHCLHIWRSHIWFARIVMFRLCAIPHAYFVSIYGSGVNFTNIRKKKKSLVLVSSQMGQAIFVCAFHLVVGQR